MVSKHTYDKFKNKIYAKNKNKSHLKIPQKKFCQCIKHNQLKYFRYVDYKETHISLFFNY